MSRPKASIRLGFFFLIVNGGLVVWNVSQKNYLLVLFCGLVFAVAFVSLIAQIKEVR